MIKILKMKMYKFFILSFVLFFTLKPMSSIAQPINADALKEMTQKLNDNRTKLKEISGLIKNGNQQRDDVFLDPDWVSGLVYTTNKEFLNCSVRYNIQKNRMEIRIGNEIRNLHSNKIGGIILDENLFIPLSSNEKGDATIAGFYEVLVEGSLALIYKYSLTLHNVGGSSLLPTMGTKQEYKINKALYFCENGQKASKLKKGKKNILKLFNGNKQMLEDFADSNGFGYRKEQDLISIFKKYNELGH
jgi:hypothetical protein